MIHPDKKKNLKSQHLFHVRSQTNHIFLSKGFLLVIFRTFHINNSIFKKEKDTFNVINSFSLFRNVRKKRGSVPQIISERDRNQQDVK